MSLNDYLKQNGGASAALPRRTVSVTVPADLNQLKSMPEASLQDPYEVAALTVAVLCVYPSDSNACVEMLNYLRGPRPLSVFEQQFLADRFRGKAYIAVSFLNGAVPDNDYTPSQPYSVTVFETPYSRDQEDYLTLYMRSGGADSPRSVQLRRKPSTGQWFLWEQMLLSDIRVPKSADPWA